MRIDTITGNQEFITYLASVIHDKSHDLTFKLYNKINEIGITNNTLILNYFLQSASHFHEYSHLM